MKLDMLHILENQTDFISTNQLQSILGYSNMYLVKKTLRELKEEMQYFYDKEDVILIISQRNGVRLLHTIDNLHPFIIDFLNNDIAIQLLITILFEREVVTETFCETFYISESSLRRKVKEINQHLDFYELKITLSRKMHLVGPENKIRLLTFALLFFIYRTSEDTQWGDQYMENGHLVKQLEIYLDIHNSAIQRDILFFVVLSYTISIEKGEPYQPEKSEIFYFDNFDFPDKPDFLFHWSLYDWKLFTMSIYSTALHSKLLEPSQVKNLFPKNKLVRWKQLFALNFRELTTKESLLVEESLAKQFLTRSFFIIDNDLFDSFHIVDYEKMEQIFPIFVAKFEYFWQTFIAEFPESNFHYIKNVNFLFCLHLMPVESFFMEIRIYIYDIPDVIKTYIQLQILNRFGSKFKLIFVDEQMEADLILGISSFHEFPPNKIPSYLCIKMNLTMTDYAQIELKINTIIAQFLKTEHQHNTILID